MKLKNQNLYYKILEANDEEYTIRAVFSTSDEDRHGEKVAQDGWVLDSFMKNPVILFGHNHGQPPVGKVIDLGFEYVDGKKALVGTVKFAVEEYEFAGTIYRLYKGEYMRAFSVGFINKESEVDDDGMVTLTVNELYEISAVPVPANAEALAVAKSQGVDVKSYNKAVKELDERKALMFTSDVEKRIMGALEEIKEVAKTIKNVKAVDSHANDITPKSTGSVKTPTPSVKGNVVAVSKAKAKQIAIRKINRAIGQLRASKRSIL